VWQITPKPGSPAEIAQAFRDTYQRLSVRVDALLATSIHEFDQLAARSKFQEIGHMEDEINGSAYQLDQLLKIDDQLCNPFVVFQARIDHFPPWDLRSDLEGGVGGA
jgi:hypothetical protein